MKAGLEDVVAGESGICYIDGNKGILAYRGYNIHELAPSSTFEETSHLLWFGRLPNAAELKDTSEKMAASRVFIEETVTGEPPESALSLLGTENDGSDVKGTATGGAFEYYEGGLTTYYKAGTGSKLQAVTADRPTMNQREFEANIVRSALYSLGWSVDFALTPGNVGGASMRVVVEQINNTLEEIRGILVTNF